MLKTQPFSTPSAKYPKAPIAYSFSPQNKLLLQNSFIINSHGKTFAYR